MRIVAGVGDLVQRTGDGCTGRVLNARVIKTSGGAVCGLHRAREDDERGFHGRASKPRLMVCHWFGLKTIRTVSNRFGPQNRWRQFVSVLASKPLRRLSPVCPQNQWRRFLAGWPQNLLRWFLAVWPQNLLRRFLAVWPQNLLRRFLAV
jgi:hypothetical protein